MARARNPFIHQLRRPMDSGFALRAPRNDDCAFAGQGRRLDRIGAGPRSLSRVLPSAGNRTRSRSVRCAAFSREHRPPAWRQPLSRPHRTSDRAHPQASQARAEARRGGRREKYLVHCHRN
ncbi:hypothetical protein EAV90_35315 [Bradyrhizobium vignae]|nr:hypothetical protein EAV90_35315 [Bradyrhizobium vignae]